MDTIPIPHRTSFRRLHLVLMGILLVAGVALGIGISLATKVSNADLSRAFATGAVTLLFGALLGGIVSLLVAELDRGRVRRAAQVEYLTNVLADLKAVYDRVDRGRTLIAAHQSAKTYGDEMRNFIEARVKLLQVVRALKFDERGSVVVTIQPQVEAMATYLELLIGEFQQEYHEISRAQCLYEVRMKKALEQSPGADGKDSNLPRNLPWDTIHGLTRVRDFLPELPDNGAAPGAARSGYSVQFLEPLDAASSTLREALRAEFNNGTLFRRKRLKEPRQDRERCARPRSFEDSNAEVHEHAARIG